MDRDKKDALEQIYRAAIAGADPYASVSHNITIGAGELVAGGFAYPLTDINDIYIISIGKAAAGMARAACDALGRLVTGGVVAVPHGTAVQPIGGLEVILSSHPIPDQASVDAARRALSIAHNAREDDLLLCLISGGASALAALPAVGITLEDKQETTRVLLSCGADVAELNTVRKHISGFKGGWLADAAFPAYVSGLIMSDVVGDDPGVVASGPVSPDESTYGHAVDILRMHGVYHRIPPKVIEHLEYGARGMLQETPKPGAPVFDRTRTTVVASNRAALANAADVAGYLGYEAEVIPEPLTGGAVEAAGMMAVAARERLQRRGDRPVCLLFGGETTVDVRGGGTGGRNQETALAFALAVDGVDGVCALFAGTDGVDGMTGAAGGFVDGGTAGDARGKGLNPDAHLDENDSNGLLESVGSLFSPGPTGTNVMDVGIILIG